MMFLIDAAGKEIARGLASKGFHVVMACRNLKQCEEVVIVRLTMCSACSIPQMASLMAKARADLMRSVTAGGDPEGSGGSCSCARLDLEDLQSVRDFAASQRKSLKASGRHLAVLVNNAGVAGVADGPRGDRTLAINHFGPFLLTNLLLPAMKSGGRVVNVAR